MTISNVLTVLIFTSVIVCAFSYLYIIPGEFGKSQDHEGYCYHEGKKLLLKINESVEKDCEEISCYTDYSIRIAGCGTFSINHPTCKRFERDYTKPYPECCTSFYCADPANNNQQNKIDKNIL